MPCRSSSLSALLGTWPVEFALAKPSGSKPNSHAVMHKDFHTVVSEIGKELSTVRLSRTEHSNHPGQRGFGAGAHIHGLSSVPAHGQTWRIFQDLKMAASQ